MHPFIAVDFIFFYKMAICRLKDFSFQKTYSIPKDMFSRIKSSEYLEPNIWRFIRIKIY